MPPRKAIPYRTGISPRIDFNPTKFDSLLTQKGYNVLWKRMLICPCRKSLTTQARTDCVNCNGSGYVHVAEEEIRALLTNAAMQKNFMQQWTAELMGTINVSVHSEHKIGWMDSLVVTEAEAIFSEVLTLSVRPNGTLFYSKTLYEPVTVLKAYLFSDVGVALTELNVANCSVEEVEGSSAILFSEDGLLPDQNVSVLYEYRPEYLIIDVLNDFRNQRMKDHQPTETLNRMPLRAIAKKKHLAL
jgi:hypothetical protein